MLLCKRGGGEEEICEIEERPRKEYRDQGEARPRKRPSALVR